MKETKTAAITKIRAMPIIFLTTANTHLEAHYVVSTKPLRGPLAFLRQSVTASKTCLHTHVRDRLVHGQTQKEGIFKSR